MPSSFGTRLRQQRERQQIALSTIAADTKINPSLLVGLERDDVSNWPGGIFRRAYIRAYARAVGLDPDAVAREFLQLYPDSVTELPPSRVWPEPAGASDQSSAGGLGRIVTIARAAMPAVLRRGQRSAAFATEAPVPAMDRPAAVPVPAFAPQAVEPSLAAVAAWCTSLGRAANRGEVVALLAEAATLLDATGLMVWSPDPGATVLTATLVHGYPEAVRARLKGVPTDADNAVASAFRLAEIRVVDGDGTTGALVMPLLRAEGCVGVFAVELADGRERRESVHAVAAILAAQLAAAPTAGR